MFDREPDHNPESTLWQTVLLLTIDDALKGVSQQGANYKGTAARVCMIEEARRYLTTPSRDLAQVCALAGMEMRAVIDRMKVKIAAAPCPADLVIGTMTSVRTNAKQK